MQAALDKQSGSVPGQDVLSGIALTEAGLVGAGCTFMRLHKGARGTGKLAFDRDCDRLMALLSVAANRSVAEAEVLPHIMAAAAHRQRGDKALANLRLVFAKLPKVADSASAYRVALAEQLLDHGWSSRELLAELGFEAPATDFGKYNPNHVPEGHGRRSGQFDFGPGSIAVAAEGGPPEDEKTFEERQTLGLTSPKEEVAHGRPITPTTGIPFLASPGLPTPVGPGPFAGKSIPAGPSAKPSTAQQIQIDEIGRAAGCHTCGTIQSGIPSGKFVGDHQPPTALVPPGTLQVYFPQCISCSRQQGGFVNSIKNRKR